MCVVIFAFGVKHDRLYCTQVIDSSVCVCVCVCVCVWVGGEGDELTKINSNPFLVAVCESQRPDVELFCTK